MHREAELFGRWVRCLDKKTVENALLQDRRQQDFIGKHLPFTLVDDLTCDPVRYDLGDDWLDLMVLYTPGWGWEIHVLDCSSEDFDLGDVYLDLRERLRKELFASTIQKKELIPVSTFKEMQAKRNRTNEAATQVEVQTVRSQMGETSLESGACYHEQLTVKRAATVLGVSIHMIYKLMRNGQLAYLQVGRRRLPLDSSVREYKEKNTVEVNRGVARQPIAGKRTFKHLAL
jgi:excisionase family DNA binding protein